MSKAFTREDGEAEPPLRAPIGRGDARAITPGGFARLQKEHQALEAQLRALRATPSSESEAQQRDVKSRVTQLEALLSVVIPQELPADPEGRAAFGARVTLEDEDGQEKSYELVGPDEADARAGRVSVQSPLGIALLGRRAGDQILFERPRGEVELRILSVSYPEGAGSNLR
jgi:transcription elongation factor GreB